MDIWQCCLSADIQRWQLGANEQWPGVRKISIAADQFNGRILAVIAGCSRTFTIRLAMPTAGRLLTQV